MIWLQFHQIFCRVIEKVGADRPASRFAKLRGRAGKGMTTDEIMELTRGEN